MTSLLVEIRPEHPTYSYERFFIYFNGNTKEINSENVQLLWNHDVNFGMYPHKQTTCLNFRNNQHLQDT